MCILKRGNNTKHLAYTALVKPILEYGAVYWDPYLEGQVSTLNQVQKRAAKFANNINEAGWACTRGRAWRAKEDRLLKPRYLGRNNHDQKIRTRKQRTDVGKYSFVNRTIKSWNQLAAGLPNQLASFRKRVKTVITRKGIECK